MRRSMYDRFLSSVQPNSKDTILDVGATSDQVYDFSNYLEAWYPHKSRITAVGIDDAKFLQDLYPGVTFLKADGRDLPFADESFDVVHSSAVLEHVGSRENQTQVCPGIDPGRAPCRFHDDAEPLVSDRSAHRSSVGSLAACSLVPRHFASSRT